MMVRRLGTGRVGLSGITQQLKGLTMAAAKVFFALVTRLTRFFHPVFTSKEIKTL
jgi:hypothetical protein